MTDVFSLERFSVRRKLFSVLAQRFMINDPNGVTVACCMQKAFRLKEDIRIYRGATEGDELLLIKARNIVDFSAAYDVVDPAGNEKVGALRRKGWSSIFRDSWEVLDVNDQPIGRLVEDSTALALLRRVVPLIPQSFHLSAGSTVLAVFKQRFNPFILTLDVTLRGGASDRVDSRLVLASAILLAAIEGRQS